MNIEQKLRILRHMYQVYDEFVSGLDIACRRTCAHCCTRNVTLTTLEGYQLLVYLESEAKHEMIEKIAAQTFRKRFIPRITINQMARSCKEGKELPHEEVDPAWGACPILTDDECPLYAARPLACRCMISKRNCRVAGFAETEEFVLTVNNLFMQYMEHIDISGCSGNFSDVVMLLESEQHRKLYAQDKLACHHDRLLSNHPLSVLMIPPQHRERVKPILQKIVSVHEKDLFRMNTT